MSRTPGPILEDLSTFQYVTGIDIGMQSCLVCVLKPDKQMVIKPTTFANAAGGFTELFERLAALGVAPGEILIGLEATSRYGENLYHALQKQGYTLCLLHPAQTHQWSKRRGLRAKTDKLDATTIARVLLSGEARRGYVPSELVASYRELIRLHTHLADEAARYKNEIHALLQVLFPEYSQVFADPCRVTALSLLKRYPGARAVTTAGAETIARFLHELAPRNYGRRTAEQLLTLAQHSVSTHLADEARAKSLAILCDQLLHTQANLAQVEKDIEALIERDPHTKGIQALAEFGSITTAVLRAELGDVDRFGHSKQVVAYAGLDLEIKESGKWKGKAKLSKRGSGLLRRMLYLAAVRSVRLDSSPFGTYYHRLVERGLPKGAALIAVMRKMLIVAAHLIKTGEQYDPTKVGANYAASPRGEAA